MRMSTFLCLFSLIQFVAAGSIISQSPNIVFANDNTVTPLQLSVNGLLNISYISLGGNTTCQPQNANYSGVGHACLVVRTRNQICISISAQYSISYTSACGINPVKCFNASNGNAPCTAWTQPSDQCSQISCYLPSANACYLYMYKDTPFSSGSGFSGSPCDSSTVCSNTFTCIPNDPPALCPWDISCQFSNLPPLHNDLVIAFTDGTNITQKAAMTAVNKPIPLSLSTAAITSPYGDWFAVSPGTPITVNYTYSLSFLNATALFECSDPTYTYNFTTTSTFPAIPVPADTLIICWIRLTYQPYNWTVFLPGYSLMVRYLPVPILFSLCPAEILAGIQTDVIVQGSLFANNTALLTCMFGTQRMPVTFLSPQTVICSVFSANDTSSFIPLTISNDGVSTAATPLQLKISGGCDTIKPNSIPSGSICVCQPGYQDMGAFCQLCSDGTYQPLYDQQSCLPCDASETTAGLLGSISQAFCMCKDGKYRAHPDDTFCVDCPMGLKCVQNETISVMPGYWRTDAASTILTPCHSGSQQCPGGVGGGNALCSKGYKGPLCSVCKKGFGLLGSACLPCPSQGLNGFVVFVIVSAALAAVYFLVKSTTRQVERNDTMGVTIKITFSYLQLLYYEGKLAANWSHKSNQFFSSLIPITLSPSFLSIQCSTEFSFYKNIALMMSLPLIIVVGSSFYHYFYWMYKKSISKSYDPMLWIDTWMDNEKVYLMLLYVAHPTISQDVIRSFQCIPIPGTGTSFMRDDMRVNCNSDSYHRYVVVAAFYTVFYIAGFLAYVLRLLRKNYDSVEWVNKGVYIAEGVVLIFFVRGYWPHAYLWEFMIMGRKLGVVIVNSLLPAQLQLVWAAVIISTSLWCTLLVRPFTSVIVGRLEILSLSALCFTILLGFHSQLMLHPKQIAIFTLLVMVNSAVTGIMFLAVFRSMKPLIMSLMERVSDLLSVIQIHIAPKTGKEYSDSNNIVMNNLPKNYKPYVPKEPEAQSNNLQPPAAAVEAALDDYWNQAEL